MQKETNIDRSFVKHLRETLGTRINFTRKDMGMTQRQLGEAVGLTPGTIDKIEKGRFDTGIDSYIKIGIALNFKIEFV